LWLNNARVPFGVEETVYRYIRQGKLVASKLGRQYRILKENVQLFLLGTSTAGEA
jgi:excisionase family DNA binding protein